jgi:hypothetical protein
MVFEAPTAPPVSPATRPAGLLLALLPLLPLRRCGAPG